MNDRISKEIVSVAQRTGRGIAVEALGGIRERVRLRGDQRVILVRGGGRAPYLAALSALRPHRARQPA
ncbi:hypothetical protein ACFQ10_39195 [Streptomyces indonesiensis]